MYFLIIYQDGVEMPPEEQGNLKDFLNNETNLDDILKESGPPPDLNFEDFGQA